MTPSHESRNAVPIPAPSHVHGLLERLTAAPSRIAPERVDELKVLVLRHGIELQVKDTGETSFEMGTMFGLIFTPMRVYQHLWVAALYFAAMDIERRAAAAQSKSVVDLSQHDIEIVCSIYRLSCECLKNGTNFPLPSNATEITQRKDYIILADEFFLEIGAFCLLHEVAHLENGDSKTNEDGTPINQLTSYQIELAADKWAYDWILSRWKQYSSDSRVFIKRTLGVIYGLTMMDEFRHHSKHNYASSHPDACERLLQFFQDYNDQMSVNERGKSCEIAVFTGLQAVSIMNDYTLPTEGFSDAISFLKLAKEIIPQLISEINVQKAKYEASQTSMS